MKKILEIIKIREIQNFKFCKGKLVSETGINRRRWKQLKSFEKIPTIDELRKLSNYFGISLKELIEEYI